MEQLQDFLDGLTLILGYGVVVCAVFLFIIKWVMPLKSELIIALLSNLRWFGLIIGILAIWSWIEQWILPLDSYNEYELHRFGERITGTYAYGVWLPLIFSAIATIGVFYWRTRRFLISWLLIGAVAFGPVLYQLWFNFIIQRHREFISANYTTELPSNLQIFTTAILSGLVCLFVICIPMIWQFIRKR